MFVKAFVTHGAIEALDEGILDGLSRLDEGQFDLVFVGPAVEMLARKLRAIGQGRCAPGGLVRSPTDPARGRLEFRKARCRPQ